jgi:hypothetical protein
MFRNFVDKSSWNALSNGGLNNVNVQTLGELNLIMLAAGAIIPYGSQGDLGKRFLLDEGGAAAASYLAQGTLYGGIYQPVQLDPNATTANAVQGCAAFILDSGAANYVVTDYAHATATSLCCGIFLNTITPGYYGFIQVHGKASALFGATLTSATAGGSVLVNATNANGTFDNVVGATAITGANLGLWVGQSIVAAAASTLSTIYMKILCGRY